MCMYVYMVALFICVCMYTHTPFLPHNPTQHQHANKTGTQRWLQRYVYFRNRESLLITYFVSAFWHGFYPGMRAHV